MEREGEKGNRTLLWSSFCWPLSVEHFSAHREWWCQASISRPVGTKPVSAIASEDVTWDSEFQQAEPSRWASSCCSGVCGLVYSETCALVALSSRRLNVSSPVFWPWGQRVCDELHPCCWMALPCKTGCLLPSSQWGTVPLVVPRIWSLLGGEVVCLGADRARTSQTVEQCQQCLADAWE